MFSADSLGRRPLYPATVSSWFRKIGEVAGVKVRPHQLRHYAATHVAPHLTETEMMGRFGWKTPRMVTRYAEYRRARDTEAAEIMDRKLRLASFDDAPLAEEAASQA